MGGAGSTRWTGPGRGKARIADGSPGRTPCLSRHSSSAILRYLSPGPEAPVPGIGEVGVVRNQLGHVSWIRRAATRYSRCADGRRTILPRLVVRAVVGCGAVVVAAILAQLVPTCALAAPAMGLSLRPSHGLPPDRVTAIIQADCVPGMPAVID